MAAIVLIILIFIGIVLAKLDPVMDRDSKIIWYNWKGERKWFKYEQIL